MAFERSIAVLDACVLYPFHLRNIIVQAAVDGLFEARWTDAIHEEWMRNLLANSPTLPVDRIRAVKSLMNQALPAATVEKYEGQIPSVELPDLADRHVVAAGVAARASLILTWNIKDFPAKELVKFGLEARTPGTFLVDLYDRDPPLVVASLANARRNLGKSRVSSTGFIDILDNQGLGDLAKRLRSGPIDLQGL